MAIVQHKNFASSAIILGATGTVGRAIGRKLIAEGIFVTGIARHQPRESLGETSWNRLITGDLVAPGFLETLGEHYEPPNEPPIILVHSAACYCSSLPPTDADRDYIIRLNLDSARRAVEIFAPLMALQGAGHILLIGSIVAWRGSRCQPYADSKAGLIHIAKEKCESLARCGITINVLLPGPIDGPFFSRSCDEDRRREYLRNIPMGRFADAEDVAAVAAFLLSNDAQYITGATIPVSGGLL